MLLVMRRSLYPRSRIFCSLLALALLAWTALVFNAFAQPLAMTDIGATTQMAIATGGSPAT
ncbi:MAG TPA: hypothetical protein VFL97_02925, partial [Nitrococcus sp.]|nr:hypothetical protein [Nitrococcus sp.]